MKRELHYFSREIFQITLVAYLLLAIVEIFKPGLIDNFFNLNYLLGLVLLTGIVMVYNEPEPDRS